MPNTYSKEKVAHEHAATGAYLFGDYWSEASKINLYYNQELSKLPTNPHISKVITFHFRGHDIGFNFPNSIFPGSEIDAYFRDLLSYQSLFSFINFNKIKKTSFQLLIEKYETALLYSSIELKSDQKDFFKKILKKISEKNISASNLKIKVTGDGELSLYNEGSEGVHYLLVGDDSSDVSYVFISNEPGEYKSLHLSKKISLKNIIDSFVNE